MEKSWSWSWSWSWQADDDAADEPHETQRTDDEALSVARDREEYDERQKNQVEEVIAQHWFTV